jgi:CheY-like chemotaxis protein
MNTMGETILVVDDDPFIQAVLMDRLEWLGHQVSVCQGEARL